MINVLDKGFVELINYMGNDNTVVSSARVSVLGESKGDIKDKQLIKYMLDHEHNSPFEHVSFTFRVKCPLFVRSQWMRHRTWSYNEVSRRYTSEDIDFYIPDYFRRQSKENKQASLDEDAIRSVDFLDVSEYLNIFCKNSMEVYNNLISNGVCREQARMILPQNMYTMFYATVNLHNLFNFLKLRNSLEAQYEIRVYAQALETIIKEIVPWSYEAWRDKNVD